MSGQNNVEVSLKKKKKPLANEFLRQHSDQQKNLDS